jgi:hypothetical protein
VQVIAVSPLMAGLAIPSTTAPIPAAGGRKDRNMVLHIF